MGYEQQIHEQASALGGEIAAVLQPAREWLARADELNKRLDAARSAEEAEYAKAVEATAASGKLPSPNGFHWGFDSPASKVVVTSVSLCHQNAAGTGRKAGPELFEALQHRVKAVVEESAKLAATVPPGVVDETTALRAGNGDAKHFTTWTQLRRLVDTWTACFELLAVMQRAQWVDGPTHARDRDAAVIFQRYLRPLSLPPGYWKGPGELRLAKAAASNAAPGMYPWQDALERWERVDRRHREYRIFSSVQRMDAMGNVTTLESGPEQPQANVPMPVGSQPTVPMVG